MRTDYIDRIQNESYGFRQAFKVTPFALIAAGVFIAKRLPENFVEIALGGASVGGLAAALSIHLFVLVKHPSKL